MDAISNSDLPVRMSGFTTPVGRPHSFRNCPICGSIEIFDVTTLLNHEGPGVSVLTCRCGALIRLYDQRHRWHGDRFREGETLAE